VTNGMEKLHVCNLGCHNLHGRLPTRLDINSICPSAASRSSSATYIASVTAIKRPSQTGLGQYLCYCTRSSAAHQRHIARYHNIFGPQGTWTGGREKAPAAICRKVAMACSGDEIEIWGDGEQTRSFLYIDECVEGTVRLLRSDFAGPVNIGSEEMVTINQLVDLIADIAGKRIAKKHIPGPQGVRGRNSDNRLVREKLDWEPSRSLRAGLEPTYDWIEQQVRRNWRDSRLPKIKICQLG
jgi:UDP-glucose 4-epimerase